MILKVNVKRTVSREISPLDQQGLRRVTLVKRFHAPGLSRLRDGRRARAEARALVAASDRGLPVPAVLGVTRDGGRWTLRLEWIEGAVQLGEAMRLAPCHGRQVDLARSLGGLLARVERAGLRHPDPHPGNVLVDADGKVWLVDLARARFGPPDPRHFRRLLVHACAGLRQTTSPGFRALVFRAFLNQRQSPQVAPDAVEVELEARQRRRQDVTRRVEVWCRTSSATLATRSDARQRIVRVRAAGDGPEAGWTTCRIDGGRRTIAGVWATLVRATLHALPTARPRTRALASPWFVEIDVPAATREAATPEHIAAFEALLADRGLALEGTVVIDAEGRPHVGPNARLVSIEGVFRDD